ncbi:hypothetical protein R2F25_38705 [Streptomyces sp. UP1A-1]|nr:hypothetical protein [Streptomyces sp. UP1A-1]
MTAVMLDSSPPVRAAAQVLLGKATRLVHALDSRHRPGPGDHGDFRTPSPTVVAVPHGLQGVA